MRFSISALTLAVALVSAAPTRHLQVNEKISDSYIVVFKPSIADEEIISHMAGVAQLQQESAFRIQRRGGTALEGVKDTYSIGDFKAYAGVFDSETVEKIESDPNIAYVEQEQVYKITEMTEETDAPWGLNRVSHLRAPGNDGSGAYDYDVAYDTGVQVNVYVIDTGVYAEHEEFEGKRATLAANFAGDSKDYDGHGHGTHCSGTIGGKTYGVAKHANIIGVKVLDVDGYGSTSGVIAGVNWVVDDAVSKPGIPAVGSMSLGGGFSAALNAAVSAAVEKGVTMAIAAGNSADDASWYSPASAAGVICVGAINSKDSIAWFSNWGTKISIFAPGVNVLSSWIGGTKATNSISGTSMATPHVAGMAAYILSMNPTWTPARVLEWMQGTAVPCSVSGLTFSNGTWDGSANLVLYNGVNGVAEQNTCDGHKASAAHAAQTNRWRWYW